MSTSTYDLLFRRIALETEVVEGGAVEHLLLGRFPRSVTSAESASAHAAARRKGTPWRFVYLHYYARDRRGLELLRSSTPIVRSLGERGDPEFIERLRRANAGSGFLEPGWSVSAANACTVVVRRGALTLQARRDEVVGSSLEKGEPVCVRFPAELPYAYPGCYLAVGDGGFCREEQAPLVRLYFTVDGEEGAVALMERFTDTLNRRALAFQIKVMNHGTNLERVDCFVLYLYARTWETLRSDLGRLHRSVESFLRDESPAFTRPLGRGWAFAEEPSPGPERTSFGQSRCMLVAEGLVEAFEAGGSTPERRYSAILRRFRQARIDVRRPFLNPRPEPSEASA